MKTAYAIVYLVVFGLPDWIAERAKAQESVVAEVEDLGGQVRVSEGKTGNPVVELEVSGPHVNDVLLERIGRLTQLRTLSLKRTSITNAGLRYLEGLRELQTLCLESDEITSHGLLYLKALTNIEVLCLKAVGNSGSDLKR